MSRRNSSPNAPASPGYRFLNQPQWLIETILSNNLPKDLDSFYDHEHMSNKMRTRFESMPGNQTKVTTEPYEIRFKGLLPKLFGPMMKGKFRQQSQKWLNDFKTFAEAQHRRH
jgi:hypothetical protein